MYDLRIDKLHRYQLYLPGEQFLAFFSFLKVVALQNLELPYADVYFQIFVLASPLAVRQSIWLYCNILFKLTE